MLLARRILVVFSAAVALVAVILFTAVLVIEHGAAKGLLRWALSTKLHRPVDFSSYRARLLTGDPTVVLTKLSIASPPEISRENLLDAATVTLHLRPAGFWLGRVDLKAVAIDRGDIRLTRLGPGKNNYTFGHGGSGGLLRAVESLVVTDSRWRMNDPQRQIALAGSVVHDGRPGLPAPLTMQADGTIAEQPVDVTMHGGGLNGRAPDAPWPMDVVLHDGRAVLHMQGQAQAPFDFRSFELNVDSAGPNLAVLGWLLRTEAPNSPPYRLQVHARRADHVVTLKDLRAKLGDSDVTGTITSDHSRPRRKIVAELSVGVLQARDLAVLASPPASHASARSEPGAEPSGGEIVGPDKPFPIAGLRKLDTDVRLRAARVAGYVAPISDLRLDLRLVDGRLTATPIAFNLPGGRLSGSVSLDVSRAVPLAQVNLRLQQARLSALRPKLRQVVDGDVDLRVALTATGASPRAMLGTAAGRAVGLGHGDMQQAAAAVLGGDSLGAVSTAARGGAGGREPIECAVAELRVSGGAASSDRLTIVTRSGFSEGTARLDLSNGQLGVSLQGHPARRLAAPTPPVVVTGTVAHPKLSVNKGGVVAGAALAALTTPLAALAPKANAAPSRCGGAEREIADYMIRR